MAKADKIDKLAEVVAGVLEIVMEERQNRQQVDARLERMERAVEGFSRMGDKVGALASALDRNAKMAEEARNRLLAHQAKVSEDMRAAGLRPRPVSIDGPRRSEES